MAYTTMRKIRAEDVTTGMVIMSIWGSPVALEVAYPIRDRFVSPEGLVSNRIRWAGWDGTTWRDAWGGERAESGKVYLVQDLREMEQRTFGMVLD